MEIEIENTKKDYIDFYKYYYFKRTIVVRIFISVSAGVILFSRKFEETKTTHSIDAENLMQVFLTAAIVFTAITLLPYWIGIRRVNSMTGTKSPEGKKKFTTTEKGFQIDSATENVFWNWESVRQANAGGHFVYLLLFSNRVYILPNKYFSSEKDMYSFLGFAQNNLIKVKSGSPQRKARQLYWWGLLGFIPFIGAISGLILLFRGIFDFKDKYLILIGAGCIMFNIGVYSWMKWNLRNVDAKEDVFASASKTQLNDLMEDVEFYKMQHGIYPDNLEQVTKENGMAWTNDPLQMANRRTNIKFNYLKVGERYYLFSSGMDGVPHTDDDIYPSIADSVRSKFGLLKN